MKGVDLKVFYVGRRQTVRKQLATLLTEAGYVVTIDGAAVRNAQARPRGEHVSRGRMRGGEGDLVGRRKSEPVNTMTLRALREILGKTQGEIARKTALSQPQLSRVEARRDHLVSTLRKYARALGGEINVVVSVRGLRVVLRDV